MYSSFTHEALLFNTSSFVCHLQSKNILDDYKIFHFLCIQKGSNNWAIIKNLNDFHLEL